MKEECRRSSADFGFVDALPDYHREFAVESGSAQFGDRYRIVTHLLRHWLPDVFWGTIFGPAYVALFGIDRLLSAPAAIVEKIADDMVYVQLSKELRDVIEDPLGMQHRRNLFKRHLATDAFYETGRGYDRLERSPYGDIFKVPAFKLFDDE
ncbi:hypothetical protein CYJ10_17260 [Cupriavidus pauculus]|uniref:Uncharacterized protein n=2 Tax=Cupriavidus pauculus TaxID=82633 RepID=A0A2N5CBK0_9BURK|nr:hypothetical protein CYJ10_17260 [Cupriavidus pauculus]